MVRFALAPTVAALAWLAGADAATACLPPLSMSAREQAAADLAVQASAWESAASVYIGRLARIRPVNEPAGPYFSDPPVSFSHEMVLVADSLLKGPFPAGAEALSFVVTPGCVPSDIERGEVGDRFVVYVGPQGASARSGMIAIDEIRHPETLAAIVDSAAIPANAPSAAED